MLATVAYVTLVLAVFAALGAPTVGRTATDGRTGPGVLECVVAGVLTLARLEERRMSALLPRNR